MVRLCEGPCGQEIPQGQQRSWCHACGKLMCGRCFETPAHDHTHHLNRQQVQKLPSIEFRNAEAHGNPGRT